MVSSRTEAIAGRVPAERADQLERAADEASVTKSVLVSRALEYYIERNPDDIEALRPDDPLESMDAFTKDLIK